MPAVPCAYCDPVVGLAAGEAADAGERPVVARRGPSPDRARTALGAWLFASLCLVLSTSGLRAEPLQPQSDNELVETLPGGSAARQQERRLRQQWAAQPGDPAVAVALARSYLEQARTQGEPRYAGRALTVLQHWPEMAQAPAPVVLMVATLQQHLHQFDAAADKLSLLLQREPGQAQAWLTLATIRRVQGRYPASDEACQSLLATGARLHGQACVAENQALQGRFDTARQTLLGLMANTALPGAERSWLGTTLAELEARAGRPAAAEAAFRQALAAQPDDYTRLAYADFLILQRRPREVAALLKNDPPTDAVLLRLAMAAMPPDGKPTGPEPAAAAELRRRMAQAALRPDTQTTHAREQAMFALWVDKDPNRALTLARRNLQLQREPVDLLLLAQVGRAAGRPDVLKETRELQTAMGLHDERLDALF